MTGSQRCGRRAAAGLLVGLLLAAGCDGGPKTGDVTGTVTVDGKVPTDGSSITFIPTDGKTPAAGTNLDAAGKYAVKVPVGACKVQIRVPRPQKKAGKAVAGPGPGAADGPTPGGPGGHGPGATGPGWIEESLPAEFNDQTKLTFDVKAGSQEKNWEVSAKK